MGTTQQMARFITDAQYSDIPEPAVYAAKLCILDSIACAIYGTTRPLGKIITELVDEMGGNPQSRVIGTSIKTKRCSMLLDNSIVKKFFIESESGQVIESGAANMLKYI